MGIKRPISQPNGVDGHRESRENKRKANTRQEGINGLTNGSKSHGGGSLRDFVARMRHLPLLYAPSVTNKIWGIAERDLHLDEPPKLYPEYTKPGSSSYVYRDLRFWTSGFFPGSLHLLLERRRKFELEHQLLGNKSSEADFPHTLQLEFACKWWTENLHQNASLTGTHDLGFMLCPWARLQWELNHDQRSFNTLMTGAEMLASRFSEEVGCIRSWDTCQTKSYSFINPEDGFLVIIDNMMNLDLLFWAASHNPSPSRREYFFNIAVSHARTTQKSHIRDDSSTSHLVVFDPSTGAIRSRLTNQGLHHTSCWTRGQSWAIAGFAEAYKWSGDSSFLRTSRDCADYFIRRLPKSQIPPWDFDAVQVGEVQTQPRDTSAALIAAYGMLMLHQSLLTMGESSMYLEHGLKILDAVCEKHLNADATWRRKDRVKDVVEDGDLRSLGFSTDIDLGGDETIVNGATINNYEFAPRRWANHGLVYADYYFLLVGNKLMEMGIAKMMV